MLNFGGSMSEGAFWEWFRSRSEELLLLEPINERLWNELYANLGKVQKGLTFELSPPGEPVREIVISADGIKSRAAAVMNLVEAAPELPGWQVTAFRPRKPGMKLGFNGRMYSENDIYYRARANGGKVDLDLYIRDFSGMQNDPVIGAVFILLDCCLGEYDVMTRVGEIDFQPLRSTEGLQPLTELPPVFDSMVKRD